MKKIFEPALVGGLSLRNRIIRSATYEAAFDEKDGFAARLLPQYEAPAKNGVGAVITGMVGVDANSRALPSMVKAYGDDYPVWIKLNCKDLTEPSITPDEFLWVGRELDKRGINAIEVSGGASVDVKSSSMQFVKTESDEGCFAQEALRLAEQASASVVSVCGFRTPSVMGTLLNKGKVEALSLCRPLISEPDLISRWQSGDTRKARCISCNKCFSPKDGIVCRAFQRNE